MYARLWPGKRDGNHAMTPPLKVARMLVSRAATGSKSRRRVLGIHDTRVAVFRAPLLEEMYVRMPRGVCTPGHVALLWRVLYGARQASWLWQTSVDRALKELDFVHLVVVHCTSFHEAWDMALTCHGDDFVSESEPAYQNVVDQGLARCFDEKCRGRIGPGFRAEGRFLKRCVLWSAEGLVWHGDPAKVGQFIALMETAGCRSSAGLGIKATGHGRRDTDQELEGSVMQLAQQASGLVMYIGMDRPDVQISSKTVMSTIAKPLEINKKSRLRKIARYLEDKPALEHVDAYQNEVGECMAFGDSVWARDRRSTTAVLEKLGNHCMWMRCVERPELLRLGCVLEKSEASWAIARFSSRAP